jgi:epsilon-lactone hydrolase
MTACMSATSPRDRIRAAFPTPETTLQSKLGIPEQRAAWEQHAAQPVPPGVTVEEGVWGIEGRLISPEDAGEAVVIHAHGGGFVMGSSKTHLPLGVRIAQAAKARLLLLDYRLAPEHPYPAARDDFLAAYEAALERGIPARNIVISGDSAGAHVAVSALLAATARGRAMPAGLVRISPWLDLAQRGESMRTRAVADPLILEQDLRDCARLYLGAVSPLDPSVDLLAADLRTLPATLVQVGDDEILLSDALRFGERLRAAGARAEVEVWPGLWHVFHQFAPELPEASAAIEQLGKFVAARTGIR